MPFYTFACEDCGKEQEKFWTLTNYDNYTFIENNETYFKELCNCGGKMKRQIGMFGLGPDIYKNDPNSNQYWMKGKSSIQVADVYNDGGAPY